MIGEEWSCLDLLNVRLIVRLDCVLRSSIEFQRPTVEQLEITTSFLRGRDPTTVSVATR